MTKELSKQMCRARNSAKMRADTAARALSVELELLSSNFHWTTNQQVDSLARVRELTAEVCKWTHEMSAYSNAYNSADGVSP